jgi:hypothetical protein
MNRTTQVHEIECSWNRTASKIETQFNRVSTQSGKQMERPFIVIKDEAFLSLPILRRRMRGFAVLLAQSVDKKWTVKGKSPWSSQSSGKDELSICWQGDLLVTWLQTACAVRLTESARLAMTQRQKGTFEPIMLSCPAIGCGCFCLFWWLFYVNEQLQPYTIILKAYLNRYCVFEKLMRFHDLWLER